MPASSGWDDLLDTGSASAADAYAAMAREIGHPSWRRSYRNTTATRT